MARPLWRVLWLLLAILVFASRSRAAAARAPPLTKPFAWAACDDAQANATLFVRMTPDPAVAGQLATFQV